MTIYRLSEELGFPDPRKAEADGLIAIGGDLSPERVLLAYHCGIFPWYSDGQPYMWWSPTPRMLMYPEQFHVSKTLRRKLKSEKYQVRFDTQFSEVIRTCSEIPRSHEEGTWITEEMIAVYTELHRMGYAHSVEVYLDDRLIGGQYGLSLGRAFFGESMFSHEADGSKIAFANLAALLNIWQFDFIDCQLTTNHLQSLGAVEVPRESYLIQLDETLNYAHHRCSWKDNINPWRALQKHTKAVADL